MTNTDMMISWASNTLLNRLTSGLVEVDSRI
jgi:hypothetical protein